MQDRPTYAFEGQPRVPAEAPRLSRAQQARRNRQQKRGTAYYCRETGFEALVRRVDIQTLLALGRVPATLSPIVNRMIESGMGFADGDDGDADLDTVTRREMAAIVRERGGLGVLEMMRDLYDLTVLAGFVDPVVVPTRGDLTDPETQVALEEIEPADREAFYHWCQGQERAEAAAVEPFRAATGAAVENVPLGEGVRPAPGDAGRD